MAMPFFMAAAEWKWMKTGEQVYKDLAKAWSKGTAARMFLVLLGMLFIQFPYLAIFTDDTGLSVYDSSAPESVIAVLFWSLTIGVCIIIPSLIYLIRIFKTSKDIQRSA